MSGRFPPAQTYTLSVAGRLRLFGWPRRSKLIAIQVPWLAAVGPYHTGRITCHAAIAFQLRRAFELIDSEGFRPLVLSYLGCYVPRNARGSSTLSAHAQGIAIDINAEWNGFRQTPAAWGERGSVRELVGLFWDCGFGWGGHWDRPDGMHFEAVRIVPPAELPKVIVHG